MNWGRVFQHIQKESPANSEDIAFLHQSVLVPLDETELAEVNAGQRNPFPPSDPLLDRYSPFDPARWVIPQRQFPQSFVHFLQWSNGGNFINGERELGIFDPASIREYLLAYHIPEYMPGAVPFALDGGGGFYLFDMRSDPVDGEYPIVFSRSGSLGWDEDDHALIAHSFIEVCATATDPNELL